MEKASEYRKHAKECRALATQSMSDEHRKQLLAMAHTWDNLAKEREQLVKMTSEGDDDAPQSMMPSGEPLRPSRAVN